MKGYHTSWTTTHKFYQSNFFFKFINFRQKFAALGSRARICKPFKKLRDRFPTWRNRFLKLFLGSLNVCIANPGSAVSVVRQHKVRLRHYPAKIFTLLCPDSLSFGTIPTYAFTECSLDVYRDY